MKIVSLIIAAMIGMTSLSLAGCDQVNLVADKYHVVLPPLDMYNCPIVDKLPQPKTLTEIKVARLLVRLYVNNITCKNSLNTIHTFLNNAEATLKGKK